MKESKLYRKVIYLLLLVSAGTALLVMGILPFFGGEHNNAKTSQTVTQGHDETNSDGHHSVKPVDTNGQLDLTNQSQVNIDIKDFKYAKSNIKITKGTTVTWTNRDTMKHNVMAEHTNSEDAHDAPTSESVQEGVLAGPLLSKDESYSFTFNSIEAAPYHCSPHPYMKGSVTVVE